MNEPSWGQHFTFTLGKEGMKRNVTFMFLTTLYSLEVIHWDELQKQFTFE